MVDRYTKAVLTAIAVLLVWLSLCTPGKRASARTDDLTAAVMSAQQFRLVDSQGQIRAVLGSIPAPDGPPALVLWDKQKVQRATLTLGVDGTPMLALADGNKRPRVALSVMKDGTASLILRGETKQPRVFLVVMPSGKASLTVFDDRGKETWSTH
jgi:hypothetical protein